MSYRNISRRGLFNKINLFFFFFFVKLRKSELIDWHESEQKVEIQKHEQIYQSAIKSYEIEEKLTVEKT